MAATFNDRWSEHGAWQREFVFLLRLFSRWLKENALSDAATEARIKRLEQKVRADKVMVAFVAEYSRGKSEMINAVFFASYGRRIMPASAGRTTMCPTEIGYEPDIAPCLRLLPVHTRLQPQSLDDWRARQNDWVCETLDVDDAEQLRNTLERVTDTIQVTPLEAQALGFWHAQTPQANPPLDAQGLVQIPKWRHALVNIAHPLLKQGLVILDTPGLNAIGVEPELTVGLIAKAQAVVFILGADTGVTQSDLGIWRDHLVHGPDRDAGILVVLNKIDTLWDELSTEAQMQEQLAIQRSKAAELLGLGSNQVLAVSAQKGLIAKVNNNPELLARSGIMALETALAQGMLGQRHQLLRGTVNAELMQLQSDLGRSIQMQERELAQQLAETEGLRGKSQDVLDQMRSNIAMEQQRFELGCRKFLAVKSVQAKLFQRITLALNDQSLAQEMRSLETSLAQPGLKLGAKKAYADTFDRLRRRVHSAQAIAYDIQAMHAATFAQINREFDFDLLCVVPPSLDIYLNELALAELHHTKYVGLRNVLRLQQSEFTQRLVRVLDARVRKLYESVLSELDVWRKSMMGALDAQTQLRRANFAQRLETVEKIEEAAGGVQQRMEQMMVRKHAVNGLKNKLEHQTACLFAANEDLLSQDALSCA